MSTRRLARQGFHLWTLALALISGGLILLAATASAFETDNFSLPLDIELADIGPFLETVHTIALQETLAEINSDIERALLIRDEAKRNARLRRLNDSQTVARAFLQRFGHPIAENTQLERALRSSWARDIYPGQRAAHQDIWMNFSAYLPFDLRRFMMLKQSRTIKAYGVYFGTDKIVHFHHLGIYYYEMYLSLLKKGLSKQEAYSEVVKHYSGGGMLGEKALFGTFATGIFSNADLAANHVGFKFFLNLTEKVVLKGEEREPLTVRSGVFWRLNQHVRPRSGWFSAFVSDHWNEALNPNQYTSSMRGGIRRHLQHRAEGIIRFYTRKDGRPADAEYFNDLARELSTYYGEPYGHSGSVGTLMTIGNTCFPAIRAIGGTGASP